jgi:predicted helicase
MLLTETGYKPTDDQRFRIFLTNSLEEAHPDTQTLFSSWLSDEADQANAIKRDAPVMVVMGNPPYSGISSNNGKWISDLIEDYKYIDGEHFKERKHWLNDDYVKFMRFGQHFIDKNGSGVLAFINPHGFLDNPTFRGMRWHLLQSFDKIYTIDLHGNTKKNETALDGSVDQNVFDIMQGVSINLFVKTGKKKANNLAEVFHYDLFGKREPKYDFLTQNSLESIKFSLINPQKPNLYFLPKDNVGIEEYQLGFEVDKLFNISVTGIVTARDGFVIDIDANDLQKRIENFTDENLNDNTIRNLYFGNKKDGKYLAGDSRGWKLSVARNKIKNYNHSELIQKIAYRLFDDRFIYYDNSMIDWGREKYMKNFLGKNNVGLDLCRQLVSDSYSHIFITNKIVDDSFVSNKSKERGYVFPLYLYPEATTQQSLLDEVVRTPNLNMEIVNKMATDLGMYFSPEKPDYNKQTEETNMLYPIDILDYIYAVLHSPSYREKYKEFLKIDFPRVPYPKNQRQFIDLVDLGSQLRQIHLLESEVVDKLITQYPEPGNNVVVKPIYKNGNVYINETQYFANVPEVAWNFYIGGYQPAQKWLKDRKDRELSYEDIRHYQKIIVALTETDRLMKEIDKIEI